MGGAISILLAQRNSKPWRGLILLAPAIIPDAAAAKPWMVTLARCADIETYKPSYTNSPQ